MTDLPDGVATDETIAAFLSAEPFAENNGTFIRSLITRICHDGERITALEEHLATAEEVAREAESCVAVRDRTIEGWQERYAKLRAALEKAFTALQRSPVSRYSQEALRVIRKAREGGDE